MTASKGPQGIVDGKLAACGSRPNNVCSEAGTPEKKSVAALPSADKNALRAAIEYIGGVITQDKSNYLASEFTSKICKFVDDLEVRIDGDVAHVRSASRVGYSDNGVNRKRVNALRAQLTA